MRRRMGRSLTWPKAVAFPLVVFLLLAGCQAAGPGAPPAAPPGSPVAALATPTAVPTATATPLPSPTATATPSPTASPTPTPTPLPIPVTGDPRAAILHDPEPQENALCGIVDLLDFPLDPPDALNVSYGGRGFGQFRSRYDLYHAGEDWQLVRGRSNLGVPVYAIGHGRVTYAHPYGWGTDQGTIIIRHTFADGRTVLSFYGHMDPDSVTLRAGDCVVRGQKIAEIGQPRTPPHLHFEIRTHMPDEPGPGYWGSDPTEAGWLPPSPFIWNNRMAAMPGVAWTRPGTAEDPQFVGVVNGNTLLALQDEELVGLDVADGRLRWRRTLTETVTSVVVDAHQTQLYMVTRPGQVTAYPLLAADEATTTLAEAPLWQVDLNKVGLPTLRPLPGGGVVVAVRQDLTAIAASGEVLWWARLAQPAADWLLTADQLILSVTGHQGPVYALTASGLQTWPMPLNGQPVSAGSQIWLATYDGLYRLDPLTMTADRLYQLPRSTLGAASVVALPDGGALLAHRELGGGRLIALRPDGTIQWQRAYKQPEVAEMQLLLHQGQPYLLVQTGSDITTQILLYAIDMQNPALQHIFTGGTRTPRPGGNWFVSANDTLLLINVGGGSLAALDPAVAFPLVFPSANIPGRVTEQAP